VGSRVGSTLVVCRYLLTHRYLLLWVVKSRVDRVLELLTYFTAILLFSIEDDAG
jgi:hypothetical protein